MTMANETDPFWLGQQKINGKLCRVDWLILQALKEASKLLKAEGGNVAQLDATILQADMLSAEVALENPPGCTPRDRTEGGGGTQ
jgi:hypothetical protein